ncbi:PREDICTED: zinc transporter ZIP1 [Drosophila arizonae]|uniref:Zinc transporter ZIP1 n=1 Tax=Drosophila arizonae TaxID=7263 RepID=A0ABM1PC95_DROAR|nr:PREDICTED: zinc transporter ZIP1 [Drosophila arizonae]
MYENQMPLVVPASTAELMEVLDVSSTAATGTGDRHALLVAKIVAMVVLIVVTVICGSLPYMLDRCLKWTKKDPEETRASTAVRCLLYFGGGVLFCTTFLHMLPEVIETVELLQHCGILANTPFALTEMLMSTGFFLMYALDELMHVVMQHHQQKLSRKESLASQAFVRGHSIRHSVLLTGRKPEEMEPITEEHQPCDHGLPAKNGHGHSHMPVDSDGSSMRGLGIILALSLHELFEGMAIGLEGTVATVWFMFGAVAAHKLVLAFCVGMELLVARTRAYLAIIYLITFSIVTPIGIGVGIAISQQSNGNQTNVPSGILQGIASGTLLYVVFFEILTQSHAGWRAYLAALAGFALMFGLQILSDEAEGADSDSCY